MFIPASLSTRLENKEQAQQHFHLFHSSETNSYKSQNILAYRLQLDLQGKKQNK